MRPVPVPIMVPDLGEAMRTNPHLKVLSANGWFDLATPFFATEYDLAHMDIDPKLRSNLTFTYYPSGHMVYLNLEAAKQFKAGSGEVLRQRGAGALSLSTMLQHERRSRSAFLCATRTRCVSARSIWT